MIKSLPNKIFLCLVICFLARGLSLYGSAPFGSTVVFKENKGQWAEDVLYKADMGSIAFFAESDGFTYNLIDPEVFDALRNHAHKKHDYKPSIPKQVDGHAYKVEFVGSSLTPNIQGISKEQGYFNYYLGDDEAKWASKVNGYKGLAYSNLYGGIHLELYSRSDNLKYDLIVEPNADVAAIKLQYKGADKVEIKNNQLVVTTAVNTIVEQRPYAYQIIDGERRKVECNYALSNNIVSFDFPNGYDENYQLIIDPSIIFSTYSGSTSDNFGYTATFDSRGNLYAGGSVFGNGYPTTMGAYQTTWAGGSGAGALPGTDIAITKYSADGSTRLYSTYLGGSSDELPHSLIVNASDELFVMGTTSSADFPTTTGAYDETYNSGPATGALTGLGVDYVNGSDMIVSRFRADGTNLLASTFLGGTGNDGLNLAAMLSYNYADEVRGEILIDKNDNIYIASCTQSMDFPIVGSVFQTTYGGGALDGCITKMDNNLSTIQWSSYLGGSDDDAAYSVALDNDDHIYVAGGTRSMDFVTTVGAYSNVNNGGRSEGFISHIHQSGLILLESTYYGTAAYDQCYFVELDDDGNVFTLGQTEAAGSEHIFNAVYNNPGSGQFITKMDESLSTMVWSTVFGNGTGRPDISPTAFLVDVCNKVYISGWGGPRTNGFGGTTGLDWTPDAFQSTTDNNDFYLLVIEDDASAISYGSYFGGVTSAEHVDGGTSRFDRGGIIYQSVCAGCGGNDDFPIYPHPDSVVSATNNSTNCNNGVFKFDFELPISLADFDVPPVTCLPDPVTFTNNSTFSTSPSFFWDFGDGNTSTDVNPTHTYTSSGLYVITLAVVDPSTCNSTDTLRKGILILSNSSDTLAPRTICEPGQSIQIGLPPIADTNITYSWSPAATLSDDDIPNPIASPLATTTYQLLVSNGLCTDTIFQTVFIFQGAVSLTGGTTLCPRDTIQLSVTNLNPQDPLTYVWSPIEHIVSGATTANPLVVPPDTTTFYVVATNSIGCVFVDSITVNVLTSGPGVTATATPDTIKVDETSQLLAVPVDAVDLVWDSHPSLSATDIENPVASPTETTTYLVTVTDENGCEALDTVTVYFKRAPCGESFVYLPNAFAPNGDAKNDVLLVRGNDINELYFTIYDRWGEQLFETTDQSIGWDGTFKGKTIDPAVYAYYLEATCDGGEKIFLKGNITLIR